MLTETQYRFNFIRLRFILMLVTAVLFSVLPSISQTTLISSTVNNGGFESGATGWTIVNGTQTNQWYIGSTSVCTGAGAAFVGTASTNNTYIMNTASTVHLYRDFVFPAGQSNIILSFDYRGQGESSYDYMAVYLVSTATVPVAGTLLLPANKVGLLYYNLTASCTNFLITLPASTAGTTQRLVFSWRNDASLGTNPPATLDNVTIITSLPPIPNCAGIISPGNGSTGLCTNGTILTWTSPVGGGAPTGYKIFLGTNFPPTNIVNGTNVGNVFSYTCPVLLPNTTYYWRIVPTNATGDATLCTNWSFTTGSQCVFQNGGNTNTCSASFFDSGGPIGNYTDSENSTVTICPSIAGQFVRVVFSSFDLEACCDYLRIYNGNNTSAPLLGQYTGTNLPCNITSSASNGCLTFQFYSDASVVRTGWQAAITCVSTPGGSLPGSVCANAPAVSSPYVASGHSTACYGNDYTNANTGSCASLYESGEDRVYAYTASGPECLTISLSNASTSFIGYQVYSGCPGTAGTVCLGSNGGSTNLSGSVAIPSAGIYYIVVDTWANPTSASYDISIISTGTSPANDLPCSATPLPLNVNTNGINSCSGATSEPGNAGCWSSGILNTVWYSVVVPSSGRLRVRTNLGTLRNTQIALYAGPCNSPSYIACNVNAPACGTSAYQNSELTVSGLIAGATYYIRVDGNLNLTGTFEIMAVDDATGFPPAMGQECINPSPVCTPSILVGNPGYQAYGNSCDFPGGGSNCLTSGERGSAWYSIPITSNGSLSLDIVPNDWAGAPSTTATDYDFAVWKIAGSGAVSCANIASGATPVRCNYSFLGVTGLSATGDAPIAYPGFNGSYETNIPVVAGEVYLLVVSNFSNSTSGFTLNFGTASPIAYTGSATSVVWTGGTNTQWALATNWGGCNSPACGVNATVNPVAFNQPVLGAGNHHVKDLTINPGGSLTLLAGAVLNVCGNFLNQGSLIADPATTIIFNNASVMQSISGALTGADRFPNLVINKTGGQIILNNDLDIGGSFTTSNNTSVFNSNGRYIRISGNFSNANGNSTFTNTGTLGTLDFNGSSSQSYHQGSTNLDLNFVRMNHSGPGLSLLTNMNVKATTGTLTLTSGRIITGINEVRVFNRTPLAVSTGNVSSFVQGFLRRYVNASGSYDFPVGEISKGYQRANVSLTSNTDVDNLLASFVTYTVLPGPLGLSECMATYDLNALNNGKWIINAHNSAQTQITGSAVYNMTLYNLAGSYTNAGGATGWTVMKDPDGTGSWGLDGICVTASTVNMVMRTGMSGFSHFGTAQSTNPLPVELLSFNGYEKDEGNVIQWETATEINNDYFLLMHSENGTDFNKLEQIKGAGNSTKIREYEYFHAFPPAGYNYYQLRQVDFDGTFSDSPIILVRNKESEKSVQYIFPNPNAGLFTLRFSSIVNDMLEIEIADMPGNIVHRQKTIRSEKKPELTMDLTHLSDGVYFLRVSSDDDVVISILRLIIEKK